MASHQVDTELWATGGLAVCSMHFRSPAFGWTEPYEDNFHGLVLMSAGRFRRRADGVEYLTDVNTGVFRRSGTETSVAKPDDFDEAMTMVKLDPVLLDTLFGEPTMPGGAFHVTPALAVAHLGLRAAIARRDDDAEIETRTLALLASAVRQRRPRTQDRARPRNERLRRTLVADACDRLHDLDGDISLQELARDVGASPFHLSRLFRAITGHTMSQYRQGLRVNVVLDRLANGDEDLATVAADAGFADHSHMTRTIVAQCGEPPSTLRRRLAG